MCSTHTDFVGVSGTRGAGPASGGGGSVTSASVSGASSPVELQVTNLDQSVEQREMKKVIHSLFRYFPELF